MRWISFGPSISFEKTNIWIRSLSEFENHIKNIIKIPNPNMEPPPSSKAPNQDSKNMEVLCTFKRYLECLQLDGGSINDDQGVKSHSRNSCIPKAPNQDFMDKDVLYPFKINLVRQNLNLGPIKFQDLCQIHDQDAKPLKAPRLKGHRCSFHLKVTLDSQNLDWVSCKFQGQ